MYYFALPDREDLKERAKVEALQMKVTTALEKEIRKNHPSDASKVLPATLNLLVVLRELIPSHIDRVHKIKEAFSGTLPVEPSPLMKEVLSL